MRTLYEGIDDALAGAPRKVESVVLNDGSAQRSMVNSLTVTFGGAAVLDPGAIELRRQDGSLVDAQVSISLVGGKTVAVLTFAGTGVRRRLAGGRQLHPDGPGGPGPRPLGAGTGRRRRRLGGRRPRGRLLPAVRRQRRRPRRGRAGPRPASGPRSGRATARPVTSGTSTSTATATWTAWTTGSSTAGSASIERN